MPDSLWTSLAGKLGEQWAAALLSPAFAFWAGGLVAWSQSDHWHHLGRWLHAAAETWPTDKYGLDAPKCWPRLWLVLPDTARKEVAGARSSLDQGAAVWLWGAAFIVWTPWA